MDLVARDRKLIWHPFTQEKLAGPPLAIAKGEGSYLFDEQNNKYLDLISSWWVNIHGHAHPLIARAIHEQCQKLEHVIFAGYTHEPAVALCERLHSVVPAELCKFFYSDNGSTSVEVALKIAYQYWKNKGWKKPLFVAFEGGYHGDTIGGMSVGMGSAFHNAFADLCFDVLFVPYPETWMGDESVREKERTSLEILRRLIDENGGRIAALIVEPLVQGAGGMKMCRPAFIRDVVRLTARHNILSVFDEVAVGFGRTGTYFAHEQIGVAPDILCLSKGLTAGFLPLALTVTKSFVYEAFLGDTNDQAFLHGHSYTGNPIGCAAAIASFDLLTKPETMAAIRRINETHVHELGKLLQKCKNASRGRVTGVISAFDVSENVDSKRVKEECLKNGIIIRPLAKTVYMMPPYCVTADELKNAYSILANIVK